MKKMVMSCGPNRIEAFKRRLGAGVWTLALAAVLTLLPAGASLAGGRQQIERPVVLVYSLPFPAGVKATPANLPLSLQAANVIDIGPNRANFPREYSPDPQLLAIWRKQGKVILRQGYFEHWAKAGAKPVLVRDPGDLAAKWAASMREEGIDGIDIDEVKPRMKAAEYQVWIKTLIATRRAFPHKYIFFWAAGRDLDPALCRAMRDHADFVVMEVYLKASRYDGKLGTALERMRDRVQSLERQAPGIGKKVLMGLGIGKPWDDNPGTDYPAFVTDQIRLVGQDPVLRRLAGIGFFAPHYADQATMRAVELAINRFLTRPLESWGGD